LFRIKRIYDTAEQQDGYRILVDRLWPRGLSKRQANIDLWLTEVAPSDDLRKRYAHDTNKWPEFQNRYTQELKSKSESIDHISKLEEKHGTVTLLFAAKDTTHNNAMILRDFLHK